MEGVYDNVRFNSHVNHNPDCDILVLPLGRTLITYGVYVSGPNVGQEFMEYYAGQAYTGDPYDQGRNYSRHYPAEKVPKNWKAMWQHLKFLYESKYLLISNLG